MLCVFHSAFTRRSHELLPLPATPLIYFLRRRKRAGDDPIPVPPPCPLDFGRAAEGGESLLEVEARAKDAVEAILGKGEELNLVVSHGR